VVFVAERLDGAFKVASFREKPDKLTAERFLEAIFVKVT
jgi:mannose-1-phosphate guanylyltransferase